MYIDVCIAAQYLQYKTIRSVFTLLTVLASFLEP